MVFLDFVGVSPVLNDLFLPCFASFHSLIYGVFSLIWFLLMFKVFYINFSIVYLCCFYNLLDFLAHILCEYWISKIGLLSGLVCLVYFCYFSLISFTFDIKACLYIVYLHSFSYNLHDFLAVWKEKCNYFLAWLLPVEREREISTNTLRNETLRFWASVTHVTIICFYLKNVVHWFNCHFNTWLHLAWV